MRYEEGFVAPFDVACPRCGSPRGQRCRTDSSKRTTDTHAARFEASSRDYMTRLNVARGRG